MKKNLKIGRKALAAALAAAFLSQNAFTSVVSADNGIMPISISEVGSFELEIDLDLPAPGDTFEAVLSSADNSGNTQSMELISSEKGNVASGILTNIPVGKYALSVSADGYADYQQEIEIQKGTTTQIELNNSKEKNKIVGSDVYGVMPIGDVDGNGVVDEADADVMMEAIEAGSRSSALDLNNDSSVNIADLAYISLNYGSAVKATPLSLVSAENVVPEVADGTDVVGNIEDIMGSLDSVVQLAPTNNAPISEENPIEVSLNISDPTDLDPDEALPEERRIDGIVIRPPAGSENLIEKGTVTVEDEDGGTIDYTIGGDTAAAASIRSGGFMLAGGIVSTGGAMPIAGEQKAKIESDGTIVIDIGTKIAVKKVTIKVTGSSTSLVDIAKVEFLNNMESRIGEPELNIPTISGWVQTAWGLYPAFDISWDAQRNVDAYEVLVSSNGRESKQTTTKTTASISKLAGGDLSTYVPYTVKVRSVSGDWKSPYSEPYVVTMTPNDVPPVPESIVAEGLTESIKVSWKNMRDTQYYSLFYREKNAAEYIEIPDLTTNSYLIANLTPETTYEIYVVGYNEYGKSPDSPVNEAKVLASQGVIMPEYKLINTSNGVGVLTNHVLSEELPSGLQSYVGESNITVDNSQATYVVEDDWDTGYHYGNYALPIIKLDNKYKIDTIRFAPSASQPYTYVNATIRYIDDAGAWQSAPKSSISRRMDDAGGIYYAVTVDEPITSDTFQLCVATVNQRMVTISEIKFYNYDDIADRIDALYEDNMHLKLRPEVGEKDIAALEADLEIPDPDCGELHPDYDILKRELEYARELLNTTALADIITIDTAVTPKSDGNSDFAMALSNNQPLGIAVKAGEKIVVYLGSPNEAEGTRTNVNLIATQNHGESANWQKDCGQLKVGRNEIQIPNIATSSVSENGGSLYAAWSGSPNSRQYSIRVSGGEKIPMLNVAGKTGEERTQAIKDYVAELDEYVPTIEQRHSENHGDLPYRDDCIANYTEIVMNNMMYSVPVKQIYAGLNGGGAEKLEKAIDAMEQEVDLFYAYKGLNKNAKSDSTNRYPKQRLNIRYHTMFAGAFMYAGGKHIGIEYGSVPELMGITPVESDEMGRPLSGNLTGWGLGHEIGHVINNKNYVRAEITNNVFATLSTQNYDRSDYGKVYDAVVKGVTGQTLDLSTALAMYSQLHMFYDDYYDFKTFDSEEEQLENLFFARVDSYSRKPDTAPGDTPLTLTNSTTDNLIRLASAAAQKDLTDFFTAWGFAATEDTKLYTSQFEKETSKIQYINPEARKYRLDGGEPMPAGTTVSAQITTAHPGNVINDNKVTISLTSTGGDAMLGYEITRNGKTAAFVPASESSYTDIITTGNNMVYQYQIVGYDKLLNPTAPVLLSPVKVKHDGAIGRDNWSVETNMTSADDKYIEADGDNGYCEDTYISAIDNIIGKGSGSSYSGSAKDGENAEFTINLGGTEQVTALKYSGGAAPYTILVSEDSVSWTEVKTGSFTGTEDVVYFDKPDEPGYMYIYSAAYVKVVFGQSTAQINNVDILGPTGDNVDLIESGIGKLKTDYVYDNSTGDFIPAGSVIFTGVYKGNPAYNVVKLLDENGSIVNGSQLVLAEEPKNGELGDVSDGIWIYWIEEGDDNYNSLPTSVQAELYRVDNAHTLEGERLVSNSLYLDVPAELDDIVISATPAEGTGGEASTEVSTEVSTEAATGADTETVPDETAAEETEEATEEATEAETSGNADETAEPQTNGDEAVTEESPEPQESEAAEISAVPADGEMLIYTVSDNSSVFPYIQTYSETEDPEIPANMFVFTHDETVKGKADLQLGIGDDSITDITAFQAAFEVAPEDSADVEFEWTDILKDRERCVLNEYHYDRATGRLYMFVVCDENIIENNIITLGSVKVVSDADVREVTVTLDRNSVITLASDYTILPIAYDDIYGSTIFTMIDPSTGEVTDPTTDEQTDITTDAPTDEQTDVTTDAPTDEQTDITTDAPTDEQTDAPTDAPTDEQTDSPTDAPTDEQTDAPTEAPTDAQSETTTASQSHSGGGGGGGSRHSGSSAVVEETTKASETVTKDEAGEGSTDVDKADDVNSDADSNVSSEDKTDKTDKTDVSDIFVDVVKTAWYHDAVQKAYDNKWFAGTADDRFTPDGVVTRGMFVTVLGRYEKAEAKPSDRFADVSPSEYYAGYVAWAAEKGIVKGISETEFAPDTAITREQIALIMYNYIISKGIELEEGEKAEFADDSDISSWAAEAVYYMQKTGIINGMPDGTFAPKKTATRAEIATIFGLIDEKLK